METIKKSHMGDKNIKEMDIDMVPKNNHIHNCNHRWGGARRWLSNIRPHFMMLWPCSTEFPNKKLWWYGRVSVCGYYGRGIALNEHA